MALIAIQTTRINASGATQIDWGNPITKGLIFASIGPDPVYGCAPFTLPSNITSDVDRDGRTLLHAFGDTFRTPLLNPVTSSEWTLICSAATSSSGNFHTLWGLTEPSNTDRIHQHSHIFDSGRCGADCRPYKSDYNSAAYTFPTTLENTIVGLTISGAANNISLYAEGVLIDTATLDSTSAVTLSEVQMLAKNNNNDQALSGTRLSFTLGFSRALSSAEMASMRANPYQVFR